MALLIYAAVFTHFGLFIALVLIGRRLYQTDCRIEHTPSESAHYRTQQSTYTAKPQDDAERIAAFKALLSAKQKGY